MVEQAGLWVEDAGGCLLGGVIVMRQLVLKGLGDAGRVGCCQLVGAGGGESQGCAGG